MKKLILIFVLLLISGCNTTSGDISIKNDNGYFIDEFSLDTIDYNIRLISFDEFEKANKDKSINSLVVIERSDCQKCHDYLKVLNEAINETGNDSFILYILESDKLLESEKGQLINDYSITSVPTTIVYDSGSIKSIEIGAPNNEDLNEIINLY